MKKERIIIAVLLALLVIVSTTGAFAYFSSDKTSKGRIKSGSLNLQLSADGASWGDSADPWHFEEMAPGDSQSGYLYMKNTGTIASRQVTWEWSGVANDSSNKDLASHIFVTSITDSKHQDEQIDLYRGVLGVVAPAYPTLLQIASLSDKVGVPYDAYSDGEVPFLPANGGTGWMQMTFLFDPAAGNDIQNAVMNYNLTVTAWQRIQFPANVETH
jgi:predicted ribosomally synthesized peptide with SipW-like signal peptide